MLFKINRATDKGLIRYQSAEVIVQGDNAYHAFRQFQLTAGIADPHSDDIGNRDNPCVRFIINENKEQIRFYVTPLKETNDVQR